MSDAVVFVISGEMILHVLLSLLPDVKSQLHLTLLRSIRNTMFSLVFFIMTIKKQLCLPSKNSAIVSVCVCVYVCVLSS